MPWEESSVMDAKLKFISLLDKNCLSFTEACREAGISRKTGYKLLARYEVQGIEGLVEQSRAPKNHPHAMSAQLVKNLLKLRETHPTWGARKILSFLRRKNTSQTLPAISSVHKLFVREGLVVHEQSRRRYPAPKFQLVAPSVPNDLWCADFKGWFRTEDGQRCDPFTLTDAFSRYCLACKIVSQTRFEDVKRVLEHAFRKYGLPQRLRTDNGPPFAGTGLYHLSRLGVWLLKIDVSIELIQPGKPQQNGQHERFHRTLKAETLKPPEKNPRNQQRAFNLFQTEYNEVRPHEALGDKTPGDVYRPSPRMLPRKLKEFDYDEKYTVRRVRSDGGINFQGHLLFVSETLIGEHIGLIEEEKDGLWSIYFRALRIGAIDARRCEIVN